MPTERISASSYSNTAPLVWSFLYGQNRARVEIILDTAPARSAELLARGRVNAALVPVIAYQLIEGVRLVPGVCVGAREKVRSVCLVTKGEDLEHVKSVSLDVSSKTSVVLTKLIFREFLGFEPEWRDAAPDLDAMLAASDCALLIGDPALSIDETKYRKFDLAETWRGFTGLGFVFAMWMTRRAGLGIDFAAARDEGLDHIDEIVSNYETDLTLTHEDLRTYLSQNISYSIDDSMQQGLELYFALAQKHNLIPTIKPLDFIT
jgi:chorismate dehydratase